MTDADTSNRLPVLAAQIAQAHDQAVRSAQASVASAIAAGERLIEAKSLLKHGQWLLWLTDHCGFTDRTAQRYMRLAKRKDYLDLKSDSVSNLTIEAALALTEYSLFPLRGFARLWSLSDTQEFLFIEESSEHPGYYFATKVQLSGEDGRGRIAGWRWPIKADFVARALKEIQVAATLLDVPFVDIPESESREIREMLAA